MVEGKITRIAIAINYLKNIGKIHKQLDVAERMGASESSTSRALNGDSRYLTSSFMRRFNRAFGCVFNDEWLLFGEGEMLNPAPSKSEPPPAGLAPAGMTPAEPPPAGEEQEAMLTTFLIPTTAQGGKLSEFSSSVRHSDCERVISPIRGVDFAITVYGDSMAPTYPSGSRVFIKKINDKSFIEWGRAYVLDTCNGAVVKILTPSEKEGYVRCISVNTDPIYAPFDVPEADIIGVYKILLSMKMEQ